MAETNQNIPLLRAMNGISNFITPPAYADAQSIDPQGIRYTESRGMTPAQKLKPGVAGELGSFQLTPIAFRDLQRINPKYRNASFYDIATNDQTAQQAMMDYMKGLQDVYFVPKMGRLPTDEELVQMYNVGPTAFLRGRRNPAYVKTYNKGRR